MPSIYTASESKVLLDGKPVEGVRSLEYNHRQARESLYAMGSTERIGVSAGGSLVHGRLRVLSTSPALDSLAPDASFQISAQLNHGKAGLVVTLDECFLENKSLELSVGGQAEAVYTFTATSITEEAHAAS